MDGEIVNAAEPWYAFGIVNVAGTDHKWKYLYCRVDVVRPGLRIIRPGPCQVCGNYNRGFTHWLEYPRELGCIKGANENKIMVCAGCASRLIDGDSSIPPAVESKAQWEQRFYMCHKCWGVCEVTMKDTKWRANE